MAPELADRDAEALLGEFSCAHDEEAFGEIVRRYAAMVFATCLRVCGNAHDAEDATQAAFLTLAVQCKSGKRVNRLGPWLRQVATRAALDVRRSRKRRETHEQRHAGQRLHEVEQIHRDQGRNGSPASPTSVGLHPSSSDLDLEKVSRVMGEELDKLPPKYRLPLVCLYFSEMSRPQVAKELGCTLGTLGVRVHRGRQMLARRLKDRGVAPPGGVLPSALLAMAAQRIGHDALLGKVASTVGHAILGHDLVATVTQGVLAALKATGVGAVFAKLKGVAVVVVLVGLSAVAARQARAQWRGIAPAMPEVLREIRGWARWPAWRLSLPKLGGPGVGTPIAAAQRATSGESAAPRARLVADDSAWRAFTEAPLAATPVKFADEKLAPAATSAMSLLTSRDEPSAAPVLIRAEVTDLAAAAPAPVAPLRLDVVMLSPPLRTDALWDTAYSSNFVPVAAPEPSAVGMAAAGGALLLLRRRRR